MSCSSGVVASATSVGCLVGRPPPAVPGVAAGGVLDDEAVLLELAQVVGRGAAVEPEPGGQGGGGGRPLAAQQAEHPEPAGVAEGLEALGSGDDRAAFHAASRRTAKDYLQTVLCGCVVEGATTLDRMSDDLTPTYVEQGGLRPGHDLPPGPDHPGRPHARARSRRGRPGRSSRAATAWSRPRPARGRTARSSCAGCSASRTSSPSACPGPTHDKRSWTFDLDPDGRRPGARHRAAPGGLPRPRSPTTRAASRCRRWSTCRPARSSPTTSRGSPTTSSSSGATTTAPTPRTCGRPTSARRWRRS